MNGTWKDGDEGWEVDWCKELPSYPDDPNTVDTDNEKRVCRNFKTEAEALAYAKSIMPLAVDGDVRLTPFVLERLDEDFPFHSSHNCHKEYTAETDFWVGDEW